MTLSLFSKIQGHGKPIILLHGLFGASDNLGALAKRLSKQYQVHSLDLRNHGNSPQSHEMTYELMAKDVVRYINENALSEVYLLGHSMGGKVAMQTALDSSERVKKLIVADIAPVSYPPHHDGIFEGLFSLDLNVINSRAEADKLLSNYIAEKAVRQLLLKSLKRSYTGNFTWKLNLQGIYGNYSNIINGLSSIKVFNGDVMFVMGGLSDYVKASYKHETLKLFPNLITRIIPEASHWLHTEKPDLFSSICERFLKG